MKVFRDREIGSSPEVDAEDPVHLEAELRAVVALTRHYWKNRLDVSVDVEASVAPFWCRWRITRLAAMRLVMLAAESQREPTNLATDRLPSLSLGGVLEGTAFELRVRLTTPAPEALVSPPDSILTLCARCLGGRVATSITPSGESLVAFRYPVRLAPATAGAGCRT